jgi:hypothetical protein
MPQLVSSITFVNVTPQFGAYLMIVIYDRKTFIVQATGCAFTNLSLKYSCKSSKNNQMKI